MSEMEPEQIPEPIGQRESDQSAEERAAKIIANILGDLPVEIPKEATYSVVDVQIHAEQFRFERRLLEELHYPALVVDLPGGWRAPISFDILDFPDDSLQRAEPLLRRSVALSDIVRSRLRDALSRAYDRPNLRDLPISAVDPSVAQESFTRGAEAFVTTRIDYDDRIRDDPRIADNDGLMRSQGQHYVNGPPAAISGYLFPVSTVTIGLTAYWSGAYYITPNNHGGLTTPARGLLQAGTYVFGVSGHCYGPPPVFATSQVCTLPGATGVSLPY